MYPLHERPPGCPENHETSQKRVLKLPTRAVQALRPHHTRQAAERLAAGEMWQEHHLVFCREDGTPLDRCHEWILEAQAAQSA
jgi:hypothetical protein